MPLQAFMNFHSTAFLDSVVSFTVALLLGTAIGAERQFRQRNAGLRTNALVALGAAAFVDLATRIAGTEESVRVISYVVSGIGFLGAGVIMKDGMNVRGLNTAATLWCSAAVGSCAGADMPAEAGLLTLFVLCGNTLLRPLVNVINRLPIDDLHLEANYEISVICPREHMSTIRDLMIDTLADKNYPVGDVAISHAHADQVEVVAMLISTAVNSDEMTAITSQLSATPNVISASWVGRTRD